MSYAVGNRQLSIRDIRRAIFDENPSEIRRISDERPIENPSSETV